MKSWCKAKNKFLALLVVIIFGLPGSVTAESLPADLSLEQVERVDFSRSDTSYLALFPDVKNDQEKISRLINMYNQAVKTLGPEGPVDFGDAMTFFINSVSFTLKDGRNFTMYLYDGGVYFITGYQSDGLHGFHVMDEALGKELFDLALSYFVPAQGVTLNSRELRLGEEVTVSSDDGRDEAKIFLMPTYSPCTIPSAPAPYPIPEAILLAQVPVEHDHFSYTFSLEEEMGVKIDGDLGKISPGEWQVVVSSGGGTTFMPVMILPREIPKPLAVAYDGGRVLVWDEKGIKIDCEINPANQPLLINNSKFNSSPITYVSFDFLEKYLEVQVLDSGNGKFILGSPELGLIVEPDRQYAQMNGTMPYLSGVMGKTGGVWRLPWEGLAKFFAYRVEWLGPDQVVFLRNLEKIPSEVQSKLKINRQTGKQAKRVKINIAGQNITYSHQNPYLDLRSNQVMVPLRETVQALGGKLTWIPLDINKDSYHAQWAGKGVTSYVEVVLGNHVWGLYQGPLKDGSTTVVSLRQLALALGYQLAWDSKKMQVKLVQ